MKKSLMIMALAALVLSSAWAQKTVTLKFGHYSKEADPQHIAAKQFADAVSARTGGAVKVEIFPNSMLGSSQEMVEQVVLGALDFVIPTEPALAKYSPKMNFVGGPFAFKDYAAVDKFFAGGFLDWVNPDLEKAGLKYIARWEWGFRTYTNSKRPINKPDDMKGLKIRTPPDFVNQETVKALGGTAQTIAFAELPMALKQGVVDGQENPIGTIYSGKMWETQKYLSILNYTYVATHLITSKATFEKLTPEQQKIVMEEGKKAGEYCIKTVRDNEALQIAEMKKNGMLVNYPDIAPFQAATRSVWETLKSKFGEAEYKKFQELLAASQK
jgi:tripartite ATP-independent transporter DctP family solute receptor